MAIIISSMFLNFISRLHYVRWRNKLKLLYSTGIRIVLYNWINTHSAGWMFNMFNTSPNKILYSPDPLLHPIHRLLADEKLLPVAASYTITVTETVLCWWIFECIGMFQATFQVLLMKCIQYTYMKLWVHVHNNNNYYQQILVLKWTDIRLSSKSMSISKVPWLIDYMIKFYFILCMKL